MKEMITYSLNINGFDVEATYTKNSVEHIFLPLLRKLTKLQKEKGRRILVYLAAPPAVGKSTLASVLAHISKQDVSLCEVQDIGMDGFHYPQHYLETHTMIRDGKEICMKDVKGCPETFDINKIAKAIQSARIENITWPIYDRNLHDVVEDQIQLQKDIILIEGNWLLLEDDPWNRLKDLCDFSIFIKAEEGMLKDRLIKRKMKGGSTKEDAEAFYERSDSRNVKKVLQHSFSADLTLCLNEDLDYNEEE